VSGRPHFAILAELSRILLEKDEWRAAACLLGLVGIAFAIKNEMAMIRDGLVVMEQ
jgi:hypothetical protein